VLLLLSLLRLDSRGTRAYLVSQYGAHLLGDSGSYAGRSDSTRLSTANGSAISRPAGFVKILGKF
jgi:hypothetical protein